jgi:hypothetical protein
MRKHFSVLLIMFVIIGCSKKSDEPKTSNDSLLQKPLNAAVDTVPVAKLEPNKWYIDAPHLRTPEHLAIMKRFDAGEVRDIYHDFRPLRNSNASAASPEVQDFLRKKRISLEELKAILEEGDRLGWSDAK